MSWKQNIKKPKKLRYWQKNFFSHCTRAHKLETATSFTNIWRHFSYKITVGRLLWIRQFCRKLAQLFCRVPFESIQMRVLILQGRKQVGDLHTPATAQDASLIRRNDPTVESRSSDSETGGTNLRRMTYPPPPPPLLFLTSPPITERLLQTSARSAWSQNGTAHGESLARQQSSSLAQRHLRSGFTGAITDWHWLSSGSDQPTRNWHHRCTRLAWPCDSHRGPASFIHNIVSCRELAACGQFHNM